MQASVLRDRDVKEVFDILTEDMLLDRSPGGLEEVQEKFYEI